MEPDGPEPEASTASVGHFQSAFSERDRKMKVPGYNETDLRVTPIRAGYHSATCMLYTLRQATVLGVSLSPPR